jgi:chromosomal replication initiation ATPase DnaA
MGNKMVDDILRTICANQRVLPSKIKSKCKTENVVFCRHITGIVLAIGFDMTTQQIAEIIGIKRSAVSLGIQRVKRLYKYNKAYRERITSALFVIVGGNEEWADNIAKTLRYIQNGESLRDKLCD